MKTFLTMPDERRHLICTQAGARLNLAEVAVEKDFWVCWTLDKLFRLPTWGEQLTFKGGTSLSKGWKLIERFSEDIDIVIHRRALGFDGDNAPESSSSKKQMRKRVAALADACRECVKESIHPALQQAIAADIPASLIWHLVDDPADPDGQTLLFNYPTVYPTGAVYLRRAVKIEMGARSDTEPSAVIKITPYISDAFPKLFPDSKVDVRAVLPKRTFWEKAMLLHEETYRPIDSKRRKEYLARHYYDLYRLIEAGVGDEAIDDEQLFAHVASHRVVFFRQNWVDYSTLVRGKLRVVPIDEQMSDWRSDYNNMKQEMFFGEAPNFEIVMDRIRVFQNTFNQGYAG
jgi:hypothetical protein